VSGFSRTVCAVAAFWILFEPWTLVASRGDGRLHITFMDVGQGDATFVRFPRGATLLVDAGGASGRSNFDVGDRVVAPVLRHAGVGTLDTLALTHGDADHIGGAGSLITEFRAREIWEGIPVPPSTPLQQLRAMSRQAAARWSNLQTADVIVIDDVEVVVRHPPIADWERQDVRNDDSIVLELRWGGVSIVLTGDIGSEVERTIAPLFAPSPLRVIKVPHHGSLTSSSQEFVKALAPRIAVASVGRSNTFGHPAPAVLERYREAGAEIFRTDRDGAVTVTTDGHSLEARTVTGRLLRVSASEQRNMHGHHEDTKDTKQ
jgi:competence protein ComEC